MFNYLPDYYNCRIAQFLFFHFFFNCGNGTYTDLFIDSSPILDDGNRGL